MELTNPTQPIYGDIRLKSQPSNVNIDDKSNGKEELAKLGSK